MLHYWWFCRCNGTACQKLNCMNILKPLKHDLKLRWLHVLACMHAHARKRELSFQQSICYLSFRWVNILHAWTINSVNRRIQKHITVITFSSKPIIYPSISQASSLLSVMQMSKCSWLLACDANEQNVYCISACIHACVLYRAQICHKNINKIKFGCKICGFDSLSCLLSMSDLFLSYYGHLTTHSSRTAT